MTLHSSFAPRLLAGFGTVTPLAGISLVASRPAHSVGGPVAVTVANSPLAVIDAGGTPFTSILHFSLSGGATSDSQTFTVPAGKRLIVQTISLYRYGSMTLGSGVQGYVDCPTNGTYGYYPVPPAIATGGEFPGSSISETFQADAGSTVIVNEYRTVTTGTENDTITVSGYLVNAS